MSTTLFKILFIPTQLELSIEVDFELSHTCCWTLSSLPVWISVSYSWTLTFFNYHKLLQTWMSLNNFELRYFKLLSLGIS